MLSPSDAANISNLSRTTIMRAINAGEIPAGKNKSGRWRIQPTVFDEWIRQRPLSTSLKLDHSLPNNQPDINLSFQLAEMTSDRNRWRKQAEGLIALLAPNPAP